MAEDRAAGCWFPGACQDAPHVTQLLQIEQQCLDRAPAHSSHLCHNNHVHSPTPTPTPTHPQPSSPLHTPGACPCSCCPQCQRCPPAAAAAARSCQPARPAASTVTCAWAQAGPTTQAACHWHCYCKRGRSSLEAAQSMGHPASVLGAQLRIQTHWVHTGHSNWRAALRADAHTQHTHTHTHSHWHAALLSVQRSRAGE